MCSSSAGTPDVALSTTARPVIGTSIDLVTSNVPLTSVGGISILSVNPIAGGVSLAPLGAPGCFVYQQLDVLGLFPVSSGSGQFSFAFPSDPNLVGQRLHAQTGVMVLNINPFNIATTNGVDLMIGDI